MQTFHWCPTLGPSLPFSLLIVVSTDGRHLVMNGTSSAETKYQEDWAGVYPWTCITTSWSCDLSRLSDHTTWHLTQPYGYPATLFSWHCSPDHGGFSFKASGGLSHLSHWGHSGTWSIPFHLETGMLLNGSWWACPCTSFQPLHLIRNAAARFIFTLHNYSLTTILLYSFKWLELPPKPKNGPNSAYLKALIIHHVHFSPLAQLEVFKLILNTFLST